MLLCRLSSKSSPPEGEAQRNLQAVLDNYQDSPDTTYEYGDRQVIAAAAARNATLNHNQLTDALDRWKESEGHHDAGMLHYVCMLETVSSFLDE